MIQPRWHRTFPKMLAGQESPDLARLYHRRVVPLRSHLALRPRRSNPWQLLTLKDAAPALPPPFPPSHGSKRLPSSSSALLQHQIHTHTPTRTLSLHAESARAPPPHPAPQEDHSKSLHRPHGGSSPGSTTCKPPCGKTEEMSKATQPGESHLTFHSLAEGARMPRNEAPERTHFHLVKNYCSALTFCSLQTLCLIEDFAAPTALHIHV